MSISKTLKIFTIILLLALASGFSLEHKGVFWNNQAYDFGTLKQGEVGKASFTCYNYSDSVLIFENVMPSCGCVVPTWQKSPIIPGDSSVITVEFDSKGKSKQHNKTIAVYTNQGLFELFVKANIIK